MKTIHTLAACAAAALLLSACGETQNDRALSGAAIGAGTGAVAGALVAGNPAGGALVGGAIGGAAGAAAGALTSPDDINLGRPAWR